MSQYCDTRSLVLLHHVCCSVLRRCLLVSTRSLTSMLSTPSVVSISFQSYSLAFSLLIISGCLRLRLLWNFAKISVMSVAQLWRFFWQKFCLIIRKFWWWGFWCPMLVRCWCSESGIHVVGAFSRYQQRLESSHPRLASAALSFFFFLSEVAEPLLRVRVLMELMLSFLMLWCSGFRSSMLDVVWIFMTVAIETRMFGKLTGFNAMSQTLAARALCCSDSDA